MSSQIPDISLIPPRTEPVAWNRRDVLLYALGTGESHLDYTYELSPSFAVLPTYPCVLRHKGNSFDIIDFAARIKETRVVVPGAKEGVGVHGEQFFEVGWWVRMGGEEEERRGWKKEGKWDWTRVFGREMGWNARWRGATVQG